MKTDSEQTRRAVLARIPLGSSIATAQNLMEADGFTCKKMFSAYGDSGSEGGSHIDYPPADILWCDSGERMTAALVISKRWQVTFVDKNDRVAQVAVGVGSTGP